MNCSATEDGASRSLRRVYVCIAVRDADVVGALDSAGGHLPKRPGDYHLTLRFVHRIGPAELALWQSKIETIGRGFEPFDLRLGTPGSFPGVIWYGIGPSRRLSELQKAVELSSLELGLPPPDFAYRPHITLSRSKSGQAARPVPALRWRVESLEIRQSSGEGYRLIGVIPLAA